MGTYRLISYSKKMSFQGFMYYEYKLFREKKALLQNTSNSKVKFDTKEEVIQTVADPVADTVIVNEVRLAPLVSSEVTCLPSC